MSVTAREQAVMTAHRIVIIEDEADILEVLRYNFAREGYEVSTATNGMEGINAVRAALPDLVLLDLLLPGLDGIEVCRRLKNQSTTRDIPIIMITAKGEESDIVLGLGMGADDYITKPFSPREVLARAGAVLRRSTAGTASDEERPYHFGRVTVDTARHQVLIDGEEQRFTATEFRLLSFLARNPQRVFTREQLIDRVIGDGAVVIDRNIDVHVRSVRKKLGNERGLIETIRGVGYRLAPRSD